MNRPLHPHMIRNQYRHPRPNNYQRGPQARFQFRPTRPHAGYQNENNEDHWCETCDRGFRTADLLDKHKQQHQKCNIDGCQFIAHPKVITKHIQMQHSSGLYKKIAKLDNPEEIKKWIEERKKKYPTRTNIAKKAAECKEKIERGEKMALQRNRTRMEHNSSDPATGMKRRYSFDKNNPNYKTNRPYPNQKQSNIQKQNYNKDQPPVKKISKPIPKVPSVIEKNQLKPFAGISTIAMFDDDESEDICTTVNSSDTLFGDDYFEEPVLMQNPEPLPVIEPVLCGALKSLICDYGSSDDENEGNKDKRNKDKVNSDCKTLETAKTEFKNNDKIKVDFIINKVEESVNKINTIPSVNNVTPINNKTSVSVIESNQNDNEKNSDDDSPEEVKTVKSKEEPSSCQKSNIEHLERTVSTKKSIPILPRKHIERHKFKPRIPSTLLYKLLHKEIRHERNIVLQCIRYIKNMNYFDKVQ